MHANSMPMLNADRCSVHDTFCETHLCIFCQMASSRGFRRTCFEVRQQAAGVQITNPANRFTIKLQVVRFQATINTHLPPNERPPAVLGADASEMTEPVVLSSFPNEQGTICNVNRGVRRTKCQKYGADLKTSQKTARSVNLKISVC